MQRWWFNDDKSKTSEETAQFADGTNFNQNHSVLSSNSSGGSGQPERKHIFRVLVNQHLEPNEIVAVTGECLNLGQWIPDKCVHLSRENDTNYWSREVQIPMYKDILYRYLICAVDPIAGKLHVRRWETHLVPRKISADLDETDLHPATASASDYKTIIKSEIDTFGDINGVEKIDRGWLTTETIIQFKFIRNSFTIKQKLKNRLLYVKLTPMNLRMNASETNSHSAYFEDSLSNDTRENGSIEQPVYALAEIATLKSPTSVFEPQSQFGRPYHTDDIMIFNVSVGDPENVAYLIDLYTYSSRASPDDDEPPYHLGYHYILPNILRKSDGRLEIPITCATKHRPLGMMNVDYVKITPLNSSVQLTMKQSYCRYWNKRLRGLDVGHRGTGSSFKPAIASEIRENTIASLKRAADHGADMVEFDVQLSKDLVPVIYHDLHVYVSLKKKKSLIDNDMLELPMSELTLEQLKHLKVYHSFEGKTRQPKFFDEDLDEHQPFPTLAEALDAIDDSVGFNIEIKWNMELADGSLEVERINKNKNLYVDCIVNVVLQCAGNRRIVFSCFDPDICTMLRLKQNLYPVMFLMLGNTTRYQKYHDPRGDSMQNAVFHACANELLGVVAHSEDLLRDTSLVNLASDSNLIVFCWGDDNNSPDNIKFLKTLGIHGIIYDKMDQLSTKTDKRSIFYVEGKESQKDILRLRQLEQAKQENSNASGTDNTLPATVVSMDINTINEAELISNKLEAPNQQKTALSTGS